MYGEPPAGGNSQAGAGGTAKLCMTFEKRPGTPESIKKFRRSNNLEPGKRFVHHGMAEDLPGMKLTDRIHGETSEFGRVTAHDLLSHNKATELEKLANEKAEKVYKARAREPLGKTFEHGYLPSKFKGPEGEAFGVKSVSSLEPAKDIIFPEFSEEALEAEKIYQRTHNNWPVGAQKSRGIDWSTTGVNPNEVRFGAKGDTIAFNGVSKNIEAVLKNEDAGGPLYYKQRVDNYKSMGDSLGRSKNLGQGSGMRSLDTVYGRPSATAMKAKKGPVWSADQVIKGMYTIEQQRPDVDLGVSITPGFRNTTSESRAYGCPSIRTDYEPPARRSLADSQNYGDDVAAKDLIAPPAYSDLQIDPSATNTPRPFEGIRNLFNRIGYTFSDEVFFTIAKAAAGGGDACTIAAFRDTMNDYLTCRDQGIHEEEAWLKANAPA